MLANKQDMMPQEFNIPTESGLLGGFRLQQLSAYNWGTFDEKVWNMDVNQQNSLLTGNIGSGKSTLVDGLTTLLVPPKKLAFNKAAGAAEKERSLESYFYGFYTSQQDDQGKARSKGLREGKHYSVLLAQFYAQGLDQTVSLAQVFWVTPGDSKPKRLYLVANKPLSVSTDFSHFGSQIKQLKKQLKSIAGVELFDSFTQYQQAFSKQLGLGSDGKAIDLFNQTISMKSVDSVTEFVRANMLQQPDIEARVQELERSYDDLKRLHDAVVAARLKVQLLSPVSYLGEQSLSAEKDKQLAQQTRELTEAYVASMALNLYQTRLQQRQNELTKLQDELQSLQLAQHKHNDRVSQINESILNNGGGRLVQIEAEIQRCQQDRDKCQRDYQHYQSLVQPLGLSDQLQGEQYIANLSHAKDMAEALSVTLEDLEQQQFVVKQQYQLHEQEQEQRAAQITALKQRQSNINVKQLSMRERLCEHLGVEESQLPFVGELLQVKPQQVRWQGAIERVLHNFSLSLMVPDKWYQQVCDYVEQTHLGSRLVYYRVQSEDNYYPQSPAADSLLQKIDIKPDSDHYQWLQKQLQQRFDYRCCEQMDDFRRSEKALSLSGQIKAGRLRHEKDDRHNLHDKSRYVLGWSNKQKLQLLAQQYSQGQQQILAVQEQIQDLDKQRKQNNALQRMAHNLAQLNWSFADVNWPVYSDILSTLEAEKHHIEQANDLLASLRLDLAKEKSLLATLTQDKELKLTSKGRLESNIEGDQQAWQQADDLLQQTPPAQRQACFPLLQQVYDKQVAKTQLRIDMLGNISSQLRAKMNDKITNLEAKRSRSEGRMIVAMGDFAHAFPNDVTELDQSPQALPEYQQMLDHLQREDLPRHESRFKEMLSRDTIRAMVLFRSYLDKQEEEIDARIQLINQSLYKLDYQLGTYIEIDRVPAGDVDIREFKQRLKLCAEMSSDGDLYSEQKFEQVKDLIEQMRQYPKWTQKVVDVRYWHLFNVIERYREDSSEKECYSDSGGKSGGQKEKLAYSILAAAIMLQYGLVGQDKSANKRRFNLVVIDEAFARGSKDSTRFGLQLFKQLGLQLLLVTPLQKLDVIEHYVNNVHYIDQQNNRSILLNMTIEQYREKLQQHKQNKQQQAQSQFQAIVSDLQVEALDPNTITQASDDDRR